MTMTTNADGEKCSKCDGPLGNQWVTFDSADFLPPSRRPKQKLPVTWCMPCYEKVRQRVN